MLYTSIHSTLLVILALFVCHTSICSAQEFDVIVHANDLDRKHSVVSFEWPDGLQTTGVGLFSGDTQIPVQYYDNQGWFILEELKAQSQAHFILKADAPSGFESIEFSLRERGAVDFAIDGAQVLRYNSEETELPRKKIKKKFQRGGYIHPVRTPGGTMITDDYPRNHTHHHGIWAAWTKTEFDGRSPDFWNMGNKTGTVRPVGLDTMWTGPVIAGTKSQHAYYDLSAKKKSSSGASRHPVALNEFWEINVFAIPTDGPNPYFLFDLHVKHETASNTPLHLPEYRYGGIGFRGHWDWNGSKNTFFLTSEGKDRSNGHATRANWCHIGGYVGEQLAGVAILSHPNNFRHPQPMRIHPTEPFFNWAPSQAGDWSITSEQPYEVTYRFVVMDGEPDANLYNRLWLDFATPLSVTLSPRQP